MSVPMTDEKTIILNGKTYYLSDGALQFAGLKTFPPKVVTGDYSLDSNPLLSAWVISDYTGGHGVTDLNLATDTNRYRYGDINTRFPKQFALPFRYDYGQFGTSTQSYSPLGNMYIGGAYKFLSLLGGDLRADETSLGLSAITNVAAQRGGQVYAGAGANEMMFIPMGSAGYAVYDPVAGSLTQNSSPKFKDFVVWDDKLIGIDATGQLRYITAASASPSWTSYLSMSKAPNIGSGNFILVPFVNQAGDPAVHILGERGVWAFDADGPKLWRIKVDLPSNYIVWDNMTVWRGDLYIAAGMDLIQWNGSVQRNLGLSRDDGIPQSLQGRIISLCPELNSLYALVEARDETGAFTGNISVHEWSTYGWRAMAAPIQGTYKPATRLGMMNSDSLGYRLVMGTQGFNTSPNSPSRVRWQLPRAFTNPRAALASGSVLFGGAALSPFLSLTATSYFETGRFNANMEGYVKIANAVSLTLAEETSGGSARVYYRTESTTSYTLLGTVTNAVPGRYVFNFGTADANGITPGLPFQYIELKLTLTESETHAYPFAQNMVMSYLKVTSQSYSWTANIDMKGPYKGRSPDTLLQELKDLCDQNDFYTMIHRTKAYRVQVAQIQGNENLARDERAIVQLSIIEIPDSMSLAGG